MANPLSIVLQFNNHFDSKLKSETKQVSLFNDSYISTPSLIPTIALPR